MKNTIVIKEVLVKKLYDFVIKYNAQKSNEDVDIITPQRALAQSKNPNADDTDVGLLIAYKGNWCVGYLGLMPGIMNVNGKHKKIIFPTTWFVSPTARGLSISSRLYRKAHEIGELLVCTGMSDIAEKIYQHMGFKPMKPIHYFKIDFTKSDSWFGGKLKSLLHKMGLREKKGKKKSKSASYKSHLGKTYKKILRGYSAELSEINTKEIQTLEEIEQDAINSNGIVFYRGNEVINWMLKYKWVLGKNEEDNTSINYAFSNTHDRFLYKAFTINTNSDIKHSGFVILSITQNGSSVKIKLLDHHIQAPLKAEHILALLFSEARKEMAEIIEIPGSIGKAIRPEVPQTNIRKYERRYLFSIDNWSNPIVTSAEKVETSYCDGDIAFT